jgi:hypothetical protein
MELSVEPFAAEHPEREAINEVAPDSPVAPSVGFDDAAVEPDKKNDVPGSSAAISVLSMESDEAVKSETTNEVPDSSVAPNGLSDAAIEPGTRYEGPDSSMAQQSIQADAAVEPETSNEVPDSSEKQPSTRVDAAVEPETRKNVPDSSAANPHANVTAVRKFNAKNRILGDPFAESFARKITVTTSSFFLTKHLQCLRDRTRHAAKKQAANLLCYRMLARGLRLRATWKRAACKIQGLFRGTQLRQRLKASVAHTMEVPPARPPALATA